MSTKTYQFQSEFALSHIARGRAEGEARGRAEGEARAVLVSLAAHGVEVPDEARERITSCTDLDQLDTWIRRAATAGSIDDLFVE